MQRLRGYDSPSRLVLESAVAPQVLESPTDGDPPLYVCAACESGWLYPAVRNTGRCPACGEGLIRL